MMVGPFFPAAEMLSIGKIPMVADWNRMESLTDESENDGESQAFSRDLTVIPGSRPLRKPAHERYARARSVLVPKAEAYRRAFGYVDRELSPEEFHSMRGNASKLEAK